MIRQQPSSSTGHSLYQGEVDDIDDGDDDDIDNDKTVAEFIHLAQPFSRRGYHDCTEDIDDDDDKTVAQFIHLAQPLSRRGQRNCTDDIDDGDDDDIDNDKALAILNIVFGF